MNNNYPKSPEHISNIMEGVHPGRDNKPGTEQPEASSGITVQVLNSEDEIVAWLPKNNRLNCGMFAKYIEYYGAQYGLELNGKPGVLCYIDSSDKIRAGSMADRQVKLNAEVEALVRQEAEGQDTGTGEAM